jgi:hypothetical protein
VFGSANPAFNTLPPYYYAFLFGDAAYGRSHRPSFVSPPSSNTVHASHWLEQLVESLYSGVEKSRQIPGLFNQSIFSFFNLAVVRIELPILLSS